MASDDVLSRLGRRVRALRAERGISQERLAAMAQLHRTYVSGVERGKRNVSLVNLARIAHALQVSLSDLLVGVD
jgi:transcriptional regulator with XRE-family HTH domain